MIDRRVVVQALGMASATFPNYPTTAEMIEAYSALLVDLDVDDNQFLEAVARVLKSQPFFPTVFAIRQEVISSVFLLAPSNALMWKEIIERRDDRRSQVRALQNFPSGTEEWINYRESYKWKQAFNPQWSHPAIGDTIQTLGGWTEVYLFLEDNKGISTFRSQVWKIYEDYANTANRQVYLGYSANRKELL